MQTTIIPQIKSITTLQKQIIFSNFKLDEDILKALPIAKDIFKENGDMSHIANAPLIFYKKSDISKTKEEYEIHARQEGIEIKSPSLRGLMYGLFTISELSLLNNGELIEFDVYDKPSLPVRALSDDISRGQISTLENFFSIIKRLARYKYNTYMPYIEDVFRFECCPAWGRYSDPISKEEWKIIIEYANSYQLEVRPIVNLLGHFDKLCFIKELKPLAIMQKDGKVSSVIDPTNEKVRPLIKAMLKEIVDCFGEGVVHCGGDEPTALTEVFGKEKGGELFIEHYTFISETLKSLNCTMMMYADFFAPPWGDYAVPVTRAQELPQGTEFVFWDYAVRESYPYIDALHAQKLPLYISPGSWTWKRLSCELKVCFNNTKGLLKADCGRARGMIMSSWGDGGDILREQTWPGVICGANFCWSPESDYSYEEFYKIFHQSFFGFDEAEAKKLDPIYQHDTIIKRENEQEFYLEFFRDPFEPVKFMDYKHIKVLQKAMEKAQNDLESLSPKRNKSAFDALFLTVARVRFCANKIAALPKEIPENIEDTLLFSDKALALLSELEILKELHRKLWFAENRNSEWEACACLYDDLYDRLNMFSRNCRFRRIHMMKMMNTN